MRHEGFVSHVRTKNRRMLHIYSIAVRPDKNDMAIEPEGMDRKEKGKGRLVKEGGEEILQMEQILNVKLKPLILLRLLSFSPLFLQPPKNPPLFAPTIYPAVRSSFFVLFSPTGQNHSFSSLIPLLQGPITLFLYGKSLYFNPFPLIFPSSHPRFIHSVAAASP